MKRGFYMKICPVCNNECVDDAAFCPKCGADMRAVQPQQEAPAEEAPSFCRFCGKPVAPGAAFCPACGGKLDENAASAAAPKPAAAVPPIFTDTLESIKTFFTKGPEKAVENAANNKGLSWIIFSSVAVIFFMFAYAIARRYRFGINLLYGFLRGGIFFFGVSALIFLALKVIHKKDVHIFNVFNVAGVAAIPIICASLLNMVFTLIPYIALDSMLFAAANILSLLLLYAGIKGMVESKKSILLTVAACVAITAAVIILIFNIVTIISDAIAAAKAAASMYWPY